MPTDPLPGMICWSEGLLLRPQHFQQAFERTERMAQEAWRLITPYAWGVQQLEVDAAELAKGRFVVRELDAVLPDGTRVQVSPDSEPLALVLKPSSEHIHLTVSKQWEAWGSDARYESVPGGSVTDHHTGENAVPIERLRLIAQLSDEVEPPASRESLPLARIEAGPRGFERASYAPPAWRVEAESLIGQECADLVRQIRGRIAGTARLANITPELRQQGALLVAALPAFELLLDSEQSHPFTLYLNLAQMAGLLAGLREAVMPLNLPRYDHRDALPCFRAVMEEIRQSLERFLPATLQQFAFIFETTQFRLKAHPGWTDALDPARGKRLVIGARMGPDGSIDSLSSWIERAAIGMRSAMSGLQDRRELGADRRAGSPSNALRPEPGEVLYTLSPNDRSPEALAPGVEDLLVVPSFLEGPRPRSLVLYVMDPPSAAEPAP